MKLTMAIAFCVALEAQTSQPLAVLSVRHWTQNSVTRVAVEISGSFTYRTDRLHNPERVYYDIPNSKPTMNARRIFSEDLTDAFVKRIRVAETQPGLTRVVLDLTGPAEITVSQLANPDRLIVDLRAAGTAPATLPPAISMPPAPPPAMAPASGPSASGPSASSTVTAAAAVAPNPVKPEPIRIASVTPPESVGENMPPPPAPLPPVIPAKAAVDTEPVELGRPAHRMTEGGTTLVRTLGLKLRRVVIDPGHGGHDQGTEGSHGLLEEGTGA